MKIYVLNYIKGCQGWLTKITELHWGAKSLPQHQLCDDIADKIAEFQDKVSEVEQSISGRFKVGDLKPVPCNASTLMEFVKEVISSTNSFYAKLKQEGDDYIGMRSDTEAFLSDMQRLLYLTDFTVKEELKHRLRNGLTENRVEVSDGRNTYSLTENELREIVRESIDNIKYKKRGY